MQRNLISFLFVIFINQIHGAPQPSPGTRPELTISFQTSEMKNPFSQEELGLLKSYLKNMKEVNKNPDQMTREQVLLHLFALHDYDKSGCLDGLELMRLLSEFLSQYSSDQQTPELVTPMVDSLLEKQDANMDGLLNLSELLTSTGEQSSLTGDVQQHKASQNAPDQGLDVTDFSRDLQEQAENVEGVQEEQDTAEESLNEQKKTDTEAAGQDILPPQDLLLQGNEEQDTETVQNNLNIDSTEQHMKVMPAHHGLSEM
ncbi:cell growth regulator with EF hand domain protein 1 [Protopterus annectens]|uniref:cell growth regulator with EF hand domain protein 1 n=1 Tax=Protopterus annectens TaxID=7888 RepID=UPI001CFA3F9A|nr:cell growth regulator with EF hand domain protein 1 [Protopterus annectens]XP_043918290.1 cell growth regulator with EF hand domain protein 1 [Protopterus annectens]XP_043918292.1 cell growth regulator with EF hand domain protein 1 [Protopterus annectens]